MENTINFHFSISLSSQSILTEVKHMGSMTVFFIQNIVLDLEV